MPEARVLKLVDHKITMITVINYPIQTRKSHFLSNIPHRISSLHTQTLLIRNEF
jgi:hypothetical protein